MFEVGKTYKLKFIENDGTRYLSATVLEWQPPLLKVEHPDGENVIINTSSQIFESAEIVKKTVKPFDADELLKLTKAR